MIAPGGIYKGGVTMMAIVPVAAAALVNKGATVGASQPVIWHILGYTFEAGAMIAALFACGAARYWIGAAQLLRKEHKWSLDIPVSAMALATSAALVISFRPEPLGALMYGAGLGVLGEGIFKLAEAKIRQASNALGAGAGGEAGNSGIPPHKG